MERREGWDNRCNTCQMHAITVGVAREGLARIYAVALPCHTCHHNMVE